MAHFYGTAEGSRREASRLGTKSSGLRTVAASWQGAIEVGLHHDEASGLDRATVRMVPWKGTGRSQLLYEGPVGGTEEAPAHEQLLRDCLGVLEGLPCTFPMCPGPDVPAQPLGTCSRCYMIQDLKRALGEDVAAPAEAEG
jgi:hypothetical protein